MSKHKILFVDDDQNLLSSIVRNMRRHFEVVTAGSGLEGLAILRRQPDISVIVSDMNMPRMDGAAFLKKARALYPRPIRILLTGTTDLEMAVRAVNDGEVFRFLTKPCLTAELVMAINSAIEQHELEESRTILLEQTLLGCVSALCEVLSLHNSKAFKSSIRVRDYVRYFCSELSLKDPWQYEIAALLSQIGLMTLDSTVMDKLEAGEVLTGADKRAFDMHPQVSQQFITRIPQLDKVAEIVAHQNDELAEFESVRNPSKYSDNKLGAQMLRTAIAFDHLTEFQHLPPNEAKQELHAQGHNHFLVNLLEKHYDESQRNYVCLTLDELRAGQIVEEDVRSEAGSIIVPKGHKLNALLISRVRNYHERVPVVEPIKVRKDKPDPPTLSLEDTYVQ